MQPGKYVLCFRGLRLKELWRLSAGPLPFFFGVILKGIGFRGAETLLPPHLSEQACTAEELAPEALAALKVPVEAAVALGFDRFTYRRLVNNLNKHTRDAASCVMLHQDGIRTLFIAYILEDASGTLKTTLTKTGGVMLQDGGDVEFIGHRAYLDGDERSVKVLVPKPDVASVNAAMQKYLENNPPARAFSSLRDFTAVSEARETEVFDARIERGLFRYSGDYSPQKTAS